MSVPRFVVTALMRSHRETDPMNRVTASRPAGSSDRAWLARADSAMVWLGERLNPILVKEARQSLKSRQFVITFGLLLLCGWVWSFLGLAMMGPEASYAGRGPEMFLGYSVILAFPLLVIVPFWAFRSLASEQEDRTYELLSITALTPAQIVSGKLGSAGLQMLIHLSAISPCLAFTYMLRGIAFPTIAFVLFYLALGSLGLSMAGLLVGTLTGEKHWQVVLSVLLIVGLLFAFGFAWGLCSWVLWEEEVVAVGTSAFWQGNAALLTAYVTYFALVFYAAVAQVTFASDNRSTRLRVVMMIQHVLCVGWMTWVFAAYEPRSEVLLTLLGMLGLHWYVMGALMTGESPDLSPRVKRRLPQSFLGRAFLTWFNPGPGTGYMFAVCGALSGLMLVLAFVVAREAYGVGAFVAYWSPGDSERLLVFGVLLVAYLTAYLGIGLLMIRLVQRFGQVIMFLGVLIQILLVVAGCAVPAVAQTSTSSFYDSGYSLLHITNPFWTLVHVGGDRTLPLETSLLVTVLPFTAIVVFLLNLPAVVREVRHVRVPRPERVAAEDAELAARKAPPEPVRVSPWDVVEPSEEVKG
jgi:ABC-type transport system involved in multi-copper enzyme maturation permease subunit